MKRANHTPGPWTAEQHGEGIMIENGRDFICKLVPGQYINETGVTEANARLIASAPDLLSLVNTLHAILLEGIDEGGRAELMREVVAVLDKVEGGDHE